MVSGDSSCFYHARFFLGINLKQINFEAALKVFSDSVGKKIVLYKLLKQDGDIFNTVVALLTIPAKINPDDFKLYAQELNLFRKKGEKINQFKGSIDCFMHPIETIARLGPEQFRKVYHEADAIFPEERP